jgi:hypothetical protein
VVVALPGVTGCDAIGKVFERFSGGSEGESLAAWYEGAVAPRREKQDGAKGGDEPQTEKRPRNDDGPREPSR